MKLEKEYSTGKRPCTSIEYRDVIVSIQLNMYDWGADPEGELGDTPVVVDIKSTADIKTVLYNNPS